MAEKIISQKLGPVVFLQGLNIWHFDKICIKNLVGWGKRDNRCYTFQSETYD
jgi:hypothetical protein